MISCADLKKLKEDGIELILMVGLPRSGKTTIAREIMEAHSIPIVNPDSIRLALHGQPYAAETHDIVDVQPLSGKGALSDIIDAQPMASPHPHPRIHYVDTKEEAERLRKEKKDED